MRLAAVREILFIKKSNISLREHWLELLFFTLLPPAVGFGFNPVDPFFLRSSFPILLVPPFLFSLRYGLKSGLISLAITVGYLTLAYLYQLGNMAAYPGQLIFGILVFTLVSGEMANNFLAETKRSQAENEFLTLRFGEFTNAYHMMKVSHDQLKEQLANAKFSLREALQMVKEELRQQYREGKHSLNHHVGKELLAIFNYFCSTQVAGIYLVDETGTLAKEPIATQGNIGELRPKDRLITQALKNGTMMSIRSEVYTTKTTEELETDLLAVIPIKDISGHIWGIVAVAEMHFTSFQEENLNLMQLLGSYTGDLLSQAENIFYEEGGREAFIGELENSWRMGKEFSIVSSIICITFQQKVPSVEYLEAIANRIRGLDHAWLFNDDNQKPVICLLMPLMAESEYQSYRKSLDAYLRERFAYTVGDIHGNFHHMEIRGKRRLYDYVSFITERMKESSLPQPVLRKRPATVTTVSLPELQLEMDAINLVSDNDRLEQLSIPKTFLLTKTRKTQQFIDEKLDFIELQWLFKAMIFKTPQDFDRRANLWSSKLVQKIVADKFRVKMPSTTCARMLTKMGFPARNALYSAIKKQPQLVMDWQVNVLPSILSQARRSAAILFFIDEYQIEEAFMHELEKRGLPVREKNGAPPLIMYAAVTSKGDYYFTVSDQDITTNHFVTFIKNLYHQIKVPLYLVLDHHPIHNDPQLTQYVESTTGNIRLFYLPTNIEGDA